LPEELADEEAPDLANASIDIDKLLAEPASIHRRALPLRPFRTVGELGCVFRDEAWRTLDFAGLHADISPDAALLDYFTINEPGPDAIVAGRIGLNSPIGDVLAAQVSGVLLDSRSGDPVDSL